MVAYISRKAWKAYSVCPADTFEEVKWRNLEEKARWFAANIYRSSQCQRQQGPVIRYNGIPSAPLMEVWLGVLLSAGDCWNLSQTVRELSTFLWRLASGGHYYSWSNTPRCQFDKRHDGWSSLSTLMNGLVMRRNQLLSSSFSNFSSNPQGASTSVELRGRFLGGQNV